MDEFRFRKKVVAIIRDGREDSLKKAAERVRDQALAMNRLTKQAQRLGLGYSEKQNQTNDE